MKKKKVNKKWQTYLNIGLVASHSSRNFEFWIMKYYSEVWSMNCVVYGDLKIVVYEVWSTTCLQWITNYAV